VPKIILNHSYETVEAAIGVQTRYLQDRKAQGYKGRLLSKGKEYNLLPYYISMYKIEQAKRGERIGKKIPLQDCGPFVRFFVPPAGEINGSGDTLSGMRDIMHYSHDGTVTQSGLLDLSLVKMYLHTMTNGILVGGDNSKMSVLQKLARLTLEN